MVGSYMSNVYRMVLPVMNRIGRRIRLMDGLLRAMQSGDLQLTPTAARALMRIEASGVTGWGWVASPMMVDVVEDEAVDVVEDTEEVVEAPPAPAVGWAWKPRRAEGAD
jgi:hypothetical protein